MADYLLYAAVAIVIILAAIWGWNKVTDKDI